MAPSVCVDYLAHDWDTSDIFQANHEIKKQLHQIKTKQVHASSPKEHKSLQVERDRLIRYQNALWRQMARLCTSTLGRSNPMVHPSSVNWQKEADITWLYGPYYTANTTKQKQEQDHIMLPPTPPPEGIKPVLKKTPTLSLQQQYHPWAKARSEPGSRSNSCSSACSSVRFSPEIERVEYLPESPVRANPMWGLAEEDHEDDEDDVLWSMVLHLGQFMTKTSTQWLWSLVRQHQPKPPSLSSLDLVYLCFNMTKSLTSLIATWVLYQSLWPFSFIINHTKKKHSRPTASLS
ncbi:hypothetical protein DM01DRAFT_1405512 [Hesseltinella vesiculosa]|uniref:Uncharacterized protein n=1 Tax=Hesseltinella vesiculosa TaxID=101127 RepID=A0A1X2GQ98_9FUNG|nr:hypothetical protein DM01DRAFT_1405512 [Hesseltinella vesiculosa]